MWNRHRYWIFVIGLVAVSLAVYFEPTHCVRGWLHGEAFFDGRPTSWWRNELEHWDVVRPGVLIDGQEIKFHRTSPWLEEFSEGPRFHSLTAEELEEQHAALVHGPRVLRGDKNALPLLLELLNDPSPKIRELARIGLGRARL